MGKADWMSFAAKQADGKNSSPVGGRRQAVRARGARGKLLSLTAAALMLFSSCTAAFSDPVSLMSPPKVSGVLEGIEGALSDAVGSQYTFVYPTSGGYRSACITQSITGKYDAEAIVFYELNSTGEIHLNYLAKNSGAWSSIADTKLVCTSVDRVDFADVCGDEQKELLIGCNMYNANEKKLNVFGIDGRGLFHNGSEEYTDFSVCTLTGDKKPQVMLFTVNSTMAVNQNGDAWVDSNLSQPLKKSAEARLVSFDRVSGAAETIASAPIDKNITSVSSVSQNISASGYPALYVDAYKGADVMITEVLYYDTEARQLVSAFCDSESGENTVTNRRLLVSSRDINEDDRFEIPFDAPVPGYSAQPPSQRLYYSVWKRFSNGMFTDMTKGYFNTTDNYYLEVPERWLDDVMLEIDAKNSTEIFYTYDTKTNGAAEELLRIRVFGKSEFAQFADSYVKVAETDNSIIGALISQSKSELAVDADYLIHHITVF